ncbi:hypothetical protein VRB95_09625 [Erwinia aphidicola]|jgi:hypothetical protein|uniref:Uncharacterized protein n=1 Tax=Erwinia aphidicola TaxID=68334 RepID=A0ABU8DHR8_ERWAP|nr:MULTISPECIES: hypothetical protein [Erwinia]KMV70433.1 hypothetical protein AI28_01000 [bacteria symbiont BFo1 of Frankliniella occidentalis]PIJ55467.1 hypothetical protein BOM23_19450 [Erwinia sp. OLMDLW33]KYP84677.1 hypothetical protein WB66_10640 [bacteria symbiont BFo1 of Frankliniella occidentalis]KYP90010.1 hypothetical protein WB91_10900 [bacteria symbiont BFo1 of Frankliniella occidentalis]MBD1376963.1 hypothetical protein [Erwinia aphidicola]
MNLSMSAWLQHKIDQYKFSVRDITVDFYMAQAKLNRPECTIEQLRKFNDTCLDMAELCQLNGDDQSYLHAMGKLHQRLVIELSDTTRERLYRMQAWQLARHSLSRLCHQLALNGEWDKATLLQSEFVKHASWIM